MARRTRTRYRTKVKRVYSRARGGSMKPLINGAMAGVAAEAGQKFLGQYGVPLGVGAVGFLKNDSTLKTIAGLQIGSIIGDMIPYIGGGGSTMGGVY